MLLLRSLLDILAGRALIARKKLARMIEAMLSKPAVNRSERSTLISICAPLYRTALGELLLACEDGAPLNTAEILDSVLTMLIGGAPDPLLENLSVSSGQLTTQDAIPRLLLDLAAHPEEIEKIRAEADMPINTIIEDLLICLLSVI